MGPLHAPEKPVHPCNIQVVLINGSLLIYRSLVRNDIGNYPRVVAVGIHITLDYNSLTTERACHFHGHGRMYSELPCFVTAA